MLAPERAHVPDEQDLNLEASSKRVQWKGGPSR